MTPVELLRALADAGHSVQADMARAGVPERGRLLVTPRPATGCELDALVRKHKEALLAYLRDLEAVEALAERIEGGEVGNAESAADQSREDHMAEMRAAVGAGGPDADALLAGMRSDGFAVSIDPKDRGRLLVSPRVTSDVLRAAVLLHKPALLALLETEGRAAELAGLPTPFRGRGAGVVGGAVAEGAARVEADGLAAGASGARGRDGGADPGGEAEGKGTRGGGGPGGGEGGPAGGGEGPPPAPDAVRSGDYTGWVRVPTMPRRRGVWQQVAAGPDKGAVWSATLAHAVEGNACERIVCEPGRLP